MKNVLFSMVLLLAAGTALAQSAWYRSNESGERLEEISQRAFAEHRYVLVVESGNGAPERTAAPETADGPQEETLFRGRQPVLRRVYGAKGRISYTERYSYYADGKLQEVTREHADGRSVRSRYDFVQDRLAAEWHMTGSESRLVRYDSRGRVEEEKRWAEDELLESTSYAYAGPEDRQPERSVHVDADGGGQVIRRYDEAGRVVEARRMREGITVSATSYAYGEHGLVREHRDGPSGSTTLEYEYDADGERVLRRELHDGVVRELLRYEENSRRVRELYKDGELVLRVFLRGEERLREQVVRDGVVVEERSFNGNES